MGKTDELLRDMGSNMEESVALREEVQQSEPVAGRGRYEGFSRYEGAGVLEIGLLEPDPEQPRKTLDAAELELLADSIRQHGLLQPLRIRFDQVQGKHYIVIGERRYLAALKAGLQQVPVVLLEHEPSATEVLAEQLCENLQRAPVAPLETARAFQRYMELAHCSAKDLAGLLHLSPSTISRSLSLLRLDEPIQAQVESGALPAATASEIAKIRNPRVRQQVADRAVGEALPAEDVAKIARQKAGPAARSKPQVKDEVFRLERGLRVTVHSTKPISGAAIIDALRRALELAEAALEAE